MINLRLKRELELVNLIEDLLTHPILEGVKPQDVYDQVLLAREACSELFELLDYKCLELSVLTLTKGS